MNTIKSTNELVRIETLSALHIGSGIEIAPKTDFFVRDGYVYIINLDKLAALVGDDKIVEVCDILNDDKNGKRLETVEEIIKQKDSTKSLIDAANLTITVASGGRLTQCKMFIRDGMGKIYIPGSSIKGSIRTALLSLSALNKEIPNSKEEVIELFKKFDNIEQPFFGMNPNQDAFRDLRIADAYGIGELTTQVCTLSRKKVRGNEEARNNIPITAEILPAKSTATFTITSRPLTLDDKLSFEKIVDDLYKSQIQDKTETDFFIKLFGLLNASTEYAIQREINQLKQPQFNNTNSNIYKENLQNILNKVQSCGKCECIIRLGFGEGFTAITGGAWFLDKPFNNSFFVEIGSTLEHYKDDKTRNKYIKHKKDIKGVHEPVTRTVPSVSGIMGFVKLSLCSEKYERIKKQEKEELLQKNKCGHLWSKLNNRKELLGYDEDCLSIVNDILSLTPNDQKAITEKEMIKTTILEKALRDKVENMLTKFDSVIRSNNIENAKQGLQELESIKDDCVKIGCGDDYEEYKQKFNDIINPPIKPLADKLHDRISNFKVSAYIVNKHIKDTGTSLSTEDIDTLHETIKRLFLHPDKKEKKEKLWTNFDSKLWTQVAEWVGQDLAQRWFNELNNA